MVIKTVFHMFKKLEESLNMLSRDMEDIQKTEIEFLEMRTTMSEMKTHIRTSDTKTCPFHNTLPWIPSLIPGA